MSAPEARATQVAKARGRWRCARATPPASRIHQSIEPAKTPATTVAPEARSASRARPSPAKIAAKERIVAGLASVEQEGGGQRRPKPAGRSRRRRRRGRLGPQPLQAQPDQEQPAAEAQRQLDPVEGRGEGRKARGSRGGIAGIGQRRAEAAGHPRPETMRKRPLDAERADRTEGRRDGEPHEKRLEKEHQRRPPLRAVGRGWRDLRFPVLPSSAEAHRSAGPALSPMRRNERARPARPPVPAVSAPTLLPRPPPVHAARQVTSTPPGLPTTAVLRACPARRPAQRGGAAEAGATRALSAPGKQAPRGLPLHAALIGAPRARTARSRGPAWSRSAPADPRT